MLYLILAIASSTSIIVLFKIFSRLKINTFYAIIVNYVVAAAFGFLSESSNYSFIDIPSKPWFWLAVAAGFSFIVGFNLFALSAHHAGVALTGMASRMSLIVAVSAGLLVFGDKPGIIRIAGIFLGIVAFYFTFHRDRMVEVDRKLIFLPVALLLVHGFSDLLMKIGQQFYIGGDFTLFLATVFLAALAFGVLFLVIRKPQQGRFTYKELLGGIVIGLANWYSGYFLLLVLDVFDVSFVIPMINIGIVTAASLIGYLVFREKLRPFNWIGVALAVIAIMLMLY
jgi:drug/metabolite transporter (DMT)-like permease